MNFLLNPLRDNCLGLNVGDDFDLVISNAFPSDITLNKYSPTSLLYFDSHFSPATCQNLWTLAY